MSLNINIVISTPAHGPVYSFQSTVSYDAKVVHVSNVSEELPASFFSLKVSLKRQQGPSKRLQLLPFPRGVMRVFRGYIERR
jgi:hypothetical protein